MKEEDFRKEIINSIKQEKYHLIDISDELKRTLSLMPPDVRAKIAGLVREKPYDLGVFNQGKYIALELKLIKEGFTFPYSRLALHQLDSLIEVVEHGGKGFVGVLFRRTLTSDQQKKYKIIDRLLNEVYMIPIHFICAELEKDKKSISLERLRKTKFSLPPAGKLWEISSLFY